MGIRAYLLYVLLVESSLSIFGIHGQPDNLGFISIDCGYTDTLTYQDSKTGIWYAADEGFTNAGLIHQVNMGNLQGDLALRYATVRYFPKGTRNCYNLRSLKPGGKYFVRAVFGYGNYDRLNSPPTFDLYAGVNYWTTVRIVNGSTAYVFEKIIVLSSAADFLQVCLVNKGSGNPFISGLDLRMLKPNLYPESTETQSLVLLSFFRDNTVAFGPNRYHFGTDDQHVRYPDDPYDRIWQRYQYVSTWTVPNSGSGVVQNPPNDTYNVPSAVMLSASTPVNASATMEITWGTDLSMNVDANTNLLLLLYFAEVEGNASRQFDVILDNVTLAAGFSPPYMLTRFVRGSAQGPGPHSISLVPTSSSMLPPLISAMEIYLVRPRNESETNSADATALTSIQTKYYLKKSWEGDPCSPAAYTWDGLNCSYSSGQARIIALYLPSSGLLGEIDPSFGQIVLLQHLNLSHNNLSGPIPDFLGRVPSLTLLDLSSNNLSGSIPNSLLQKSQDGLLTLRVDNNPFLCVNYTCNSVSPNRKKFELALELGLGLGVPVLMLVAAVAGCFIKRRRLKALPNPHFVAIGGTVGGGHVASAVENDQDKDNHADMATGSQQEPVGDSSYHLPTHPQHFSYDELKLITDDFKDKIGEGGFGPVFSGKLLGVGTPVAVKRRSPDTSSSSLDKQFLAEVKHLIGSRHKNVVSLLGYCEDEGKLGLVYEYMDGGDLKERLRKGATGEEVPLTWPQRHKIAVHCAQGLNYLHTGFKTPLVHRDVKATNILLTRNLDAKIADFGLARPLSGESITHTNTSVVCGTFGYIDPVYLTTGNLSDKSDVFSFGVVLLVLITNRQTSIDGEDKHIAEWVRESFSRRGRSRDEYISSIIDETIKGHCDVNSVWKVAQLALRCAHRDVSVRPTMTEVVAELVAALRRDEQGSGVPRGRACCWGA